MHASLYRDAAESPLASTEADYAVIASREVLSAAVSTFRGNLPMARAAFERFVLDICGEAVAQALEDAGGGGSQRAGHEIVGQLVAEVSKFANPWLAFRCIPIVFRLGADEGDQTELAAEFGVTKGDVSAICVKLQDRFGLPPGHGMKRPEARRNYRARQIGRRARPVAMAWRHRGLFAA